MNISPPFFWLMVSLIGYLIMGQATLPVTLWSLRRHVSPPPQHLDREVRRSTRILWPLFLCQVAAEEIPRRLREEFKMRVFWVVQGILAGDWRKPIWHCTCGGWGRVGGYSRMRCVKCYGLELDESSSRA